MCVVAESGKCATPLYFESTGDNDNRTVGDENESLKGFHSLSNMCNKSGIFMGGGGEV